MVSFISITNGVLLISTMMISLSFATPADDNTNVAQSDYNALPALISGRVQPGLSIDTLDDTSENLRSGDDNTNTFQGLDIVLSPDAPPIASIPDIPSVQPASRSQIAEFKYYAAVVSTAYCSSVIPDEKWSCGHCLEYIPDGELITTFTANDGDTSGYVLRSDEDKKIYLVFRGTYSVRNAITNWVFYQEDYYPVKGAKVHSAFYDSFRDNVGLYFSIVRAQLDNHPDYKIVVTGHSLGAAQALLAGLNIYQRDERITPDNLSIYTLGGPRVGNPEFAQYVRSTGIPFYRSVNQRDIVPHLPPKALGYLHAGLEIWTVSSEDVRLCNSTIEDRACSNSIVPYTNFFDHFAYYDINEGFCL